ncbi:hypothetical protein [Spirosoma radiotolerans]|uniref:Uncharacterized protein n=1 Tax=Spirosoma radiotolerans TaxID=1379870 RepID=A0A0E3ZVB7_9BACT|nr:hypothetical protein [Spirosoma radiotolerans]AKD55013.1 hypothetical protein SD10_08965 [Spirosoma radiotolerans]
MDNNGEQSAFPLDINEGMPQWGLSKREYFAAQALMKLSDKYESPSTVAKQAVEIADALIEVLNK